MLSPAYPAGFIAPCLPTRSRTVPDGRRWAFEIKHDGFRFVARRDGDRVRVFSRHGKEWSDRVPLIVEAMLALPVISAPMTTKEWPTIGAPTLRIRPGAGLAPRNELSPFQPVVFSVK
jgi:hypothetical protein